MRKYRKALKDELEDIVCDICGGSCLTDCSKAMGGGSSAAEYATLEGIWGYCSGRDGERYTCEMCEACFEKVSGFIASLKGPAASS